MSEISPDMVLAAAKAIYALKPTIIMARWPGGKQKVVRLPWDWSYSDFGDLKYLGPDTVARRSSQAHDDRRLCMKYAEAALRAALSIEQP